MIPAVGTTSEPVPPLGELDCVINPSVVADLGSSAPGILRVVHVDRSDFVDAGQVIAELESGVESASVDLARTRADSTAEVDLRRVNAAYGSRLHHRTKDLFQRKVVSSNDLDERATEARLGRIQLRQALDNQSIAKVELVRAEEILKRRTIKSPITGVVMERFKVVGEYVEDQPITRVAQLDPLHVEVIVPVEYLGKIVPGMSAEVWADAVHSDRWPATVSRVDKVADVASGTYGVRLSLANPDYEIPAGLRCRMQLLDPPPAPISAAKESDEGRPAEPAVVETPALPEPAVAVPAPEPTVVSARGPAAVEPPVADVEATQDAGLPVADQAAAVVAVATPAEPTFPAAPVVPAVDAPPAAAAPAAVSKTTAVTGDDRHGPDAVPEASVLSSSVATTAADETKSAAVGPAEPIEEAPVADANTVCRVAGPFKNELDATRHVVKLRRVGFEVEMKTAAKPTDVEFKVMTPVLADPAAAEKVVKAINSAGLSDYFVYEMPAEKRRVYLGIYHSERLAGRRVRALSKAGVKAFYRASKTGRSDYFVVIRGSAGPKNDRLLAAFPAAPKGPAADLGFCPKLASR